MTYTNETIAHAFFYEDGDLIKNHLHLWKSQNVIYSYSTPIAILTKDKNNNDILILSSNNMTHTTSRHISYIRRAAPCNIVYYPFFINNYFSDFCSVKRDLIDSLEEYKTLNDSFECMRFIEYFKSLEDLNEYFDLDEYFKKYELLYLKAKGSLPSIKKLESLEKRRATIKENKEIKERFENMSIEDFENIKYFDSKEKKYLKNNSGLFLNKLSEKYSYLDLIKKTYTGDFSYFLKDILKACLKDDEYSYLYIKDDLIKTSRGISQKIEDMKPFLIGWRKGLLKHGEKIGVYTILSITDDFVKIGCHKIPTENIRKIYEAVF